MNTSEHISEHNRTHREGGNVGKVHKSLRIEESLEARAQALKAEGESDATAYGRIIEAGLDALEGRAQEQTQGGEAAACKEENPSSLQAVVDVQAAHIADLQTRLAKADEQLATKDGQIKALEGITQAAQQLHGASDVIHVKQLESTEAKKQGRWARAWAAFTGKEKEA